MWSVNKVFESLEAHFVFSYWEGRKEDGKIFVSKANALKRKANETRIDWLDRWIARKQLYIMPTYHYVQNQGKLMMQSRENGQKPQLGQFFDDFEVRHLQIANFSEKCFI